MTARHTQGSAAWIDPARRDTTEGTGVLTVAQRAALKAWRADARKGFSLDQRARIKSK